MIRLNGNKLEFGEFPNGEIYLRKDYLRFNRSYNEVTFKYEGDADLFKLLLVRESLTGTANLHVTYFPYSRMDRDSKDYMFSLKTLTSVINSMNWNEITIYEPHSDVTPALIDRGRVQNVIFPHLISRLSSKAAVSDYQLFFPDAGAQKRYENIPTKRSTLVGFKHRDFTTGRILGLEIMGKPECSTVVIVDDLCSKGGTFILAAEKLRELGFTNVILVVAHCEKTIFEGQVLKSKLIDHVITTDSILDTEEFYKNIHIIPFKEMFGV